MPDPQAALPAMPREGDVDPDSLVPPKDDRARRVLLLGGIGLAAYLAALIMTIPASLVLSTPAAGTLWRGTALLDADNRLESRWAPLRSLLALGFAVDWRIEGPASAIAGRALLRPGSRSVDDVSGIVDGALLQRLGGWSFACAMPLQVDLKQARIGGRDQRLEGAIRSDAGLCQASGGAAAVAVPALSLTLRQTSGLAVINLSAAGRIRHPLVVGGLSSDGHLRLIVTREGAVVLPFVSPAGGAKIETDF